MISQSDIESALPIFLRDTFRADSLTTPRLLPCINRFVEWFDNSRVPFFKDYTDHSSVHSFDVFKTGMEFIETNTQRLISARDISYFALSCFCHDAGMHLTEVHFSALLDQHDSCVSAFGDISWPSLWEQFFREVRRYNENALVDLFGESQPVDPLPTDHKYWTDRHRMLIGEFLRRHHSRLSHELAMGLDRKIGLGHLLQGFSEEESDLIGLISRSHGMSLRPLFSYINQNFDLRDYNRTHVIFLMILLRVADFVQIQSSRAPSIKLIIHPVSSPISQQEWRVHNSVKNITRTHDDPEAIYVDALPSNAQDFFRIKNWLEELQRELDTSWAIIGEVYGRQIDSGLAGLKLAIRRVRSSIFDGKYKLKYVARPMRFRVAEAEILGLLIKPLYGDHPGYGIRELIQNAYDAVSEGMVLHRHHYIRTDPAVRIAISICKDIGTLTVTDNGVGMNENILDEYFLNSGNSLRSSMYWKSKFVGADGKITVTRSGRFGIGAIAAFLIGDEIEVQTRCYQSNEDEGLHFKARLHDRNIEIKRVNCEAGTVIKIDFSREKFAYLMEFVEDAETIFRFDPKIKVELRYFDESSSKLYELTSKNIDFQRSHTFSTPDFPKITIKSGTKIQTEITYVNGIAIQPLSRTNSASGTPYKLLEILHPPAWFISGYRFYFRPMQMEIVDDHAMSPINLARNIFTETSKQIEDAIQEFVFEDILRIISQRHHSTSLIKADGIFYNVENLKLLHYRGGVIPADAHLIFDAGIKAVVIMPSKTSNASKLSLIFDDIAFMTLDRTSIIDTSFRSYADFLQSDPNKHVYLNFRMSHFHSNILSLSSGVAHWEKIREYDVESIRYGMLPVRTTRNFKMEARLRDVAAQANAQEMEFLTSETWSSASSLRERSRTPFSRKWSTVFANENYVFRGR